MFQSAIFFKFRYEDYKSPRTALYMNLLRLFLLTLVVIGILITYWTESGNGAQVSVKNLVDSFSFSVSVLDLF